MIVLRGDGNREVDGLAVIDRQHVIHSGVLIPDCFLRVPRPQVSSVRACWQMVRPIVDLVL
jgi:hypothetical protein